MPDHTDVPSAEDAPSDLSTEIGNSLASVWARYVGARPSNAETQLDGGVVRWVLADGTSEFAEGISVEGEDGEELTPKRKMSRYKRDTSAAVAKITHRKVVAMISKHDAKTGIARETFILEVAPKKY